MKYLRCVFSLAVCLSVHLAPARADLIARIHDSGFALAHDTYNGMGAASDGRIYYVLSSESYEVGAQMFCYDPATDKIEHVGVSPRPAARRTPRPSSRASRT